MSHIPDMSELPDRVAETFIGQTVLITGGTGFTGKVLIEKLLRKCPDIGQIILLVRSKKGKHPRERLYAMLSDPLFSQIIEKSGLDNVLDKIKIVCADISEPDLMMQDTDRLYIQNNVDIIVHAAATVRFDEILKKAVLLNVRGTKLILELGKTCSKLKLFVHISTAYCHSDIKLLEEKPYELNTDPNKVIAIVETLDDASIESITPKLLDKLPNTYAFTKALAETLVVEAMNDMPVIMLRPSIVVPIWREPLPGWTDNIKGPTGLLIGAGKGVIRSMLCRSDSYADYMPVDIFINGVMIAIWNYLKNGDKNTTICNMTSSAEVKISWSELIETGKEIVLKKIPFNNVVWIPGGSMKQSHLAHNISALFFHWIPAILVDTLLFLLGIDPVLIRVHKRISKGFDVLEYYTNNQWDFKSENFQRLRTLLNNREKEDYKVDANGLNFSSYMEDCILGARRYILKESDETIPAAKRHIKIMQAVDLIAKFVFIGFFFWILSRVTMSVFSAKDQLQVV